MANKIARALYQHSSNTVYQYTPRLAVREDMTEVWYDFDEKRIVSQAEAKSVVDESLHGVPVIVTPQYKADDLTSAAKTTAPETQRVAKQVKRKQPDAVVIDASPTLPIGVDLNAGVVQNPDLLPAEPTFNQIPTAQIPTLQIPTAAIPATSLKIDLSQFAAG